MHKNSLTLGKYVLNCRFYAEKKKQLLYEEINP